MKLLISVLATACLLISGGAFAADASKPMAKSHHHKASKTSHKKAPVASKA